MLLKRLELLKVLEKTFGRTKRLAEEALEKLAAGFQKQLAVCVTKSFRKEVVQVLKKEKSSRTLPRCVRKRNGI